MNLKSCSDCGCVVDFNSMVEIDIPTNISREDYNKEYEKLKKTKKYYELSEYYADCFYCPCCNKWVCVSGD